MLSLESVELKKQKKLALAWSIAFLLLFPLLILLGFLMRLGQGEVLKLLLANYYAFMTLHGLGMAGVLLSMAFAAIWYLISTRFAKLNIIIGYFVYFMNLVGFAVLTIATLIGKFGPGWNMLYPLPFKNPTWYSWSIAASIIALIILGIAWLTGFLHLVFALSKEYGGVSKLLGWQFFTKNKNRKELPPIILVTAISTISGIFVLLSGAVMSIIYLVKFFEPELILDPILLKNITLFFSNTLVNITMYFGVGWVYVLLPEFSGNEWKINKSLVYAWNVTFLFILLAFLVNMFIDFEQNLAFQWVGQILFYLSVLPAAAVTIFGVVVRFHFAKIKWNIIPLLILFGTAGWAIGCFAEAASFATGANIVLRNTLWVTAYFHTYSLMGIIFYLFAFIFYLFSEKKEERGEKIAKAGFWLFVIGSYGFLLMLYLGGLWSIPRSYARYAGLYISDMHGTAVHLAQVSALFIILLITGLLIMYFSLGIKLLKKA